MNTVKKNQAVTCQQIEQLLLEREISDVEIGQLIILESHLKNCANCRKFEDKLNHLVITTQAFNLPLLEPDIGIWKRLIGCIKKQKEMQKDQEHRSGICPLFEESPDSEKSMEFILRTTLANMNIQQRGTFLLYYFQNLSIEQIAEILKCSKKSVKSHLLFSSYLVVKNLSILNLHSN